MKTITVKKYKRHGFVVKGHRRRVRKLGKKISYKPIGTFKVAHDELGNFRGSKIELKPKLKRKREVDSNLDTQYFEGKIGLKEWLARKELS